MLTPQIRHIPEKFPEDLTLVFTILFMLLSRDMGKKFYTDGKN